MRGKERGKRLAQQGREENYYLVLTTTALWKGVRLISERRLGRVVGGQKINSKIQLLL